MPTGRNRSKPEPIRQAGPCSRPRQPPLLPCLPDYLPVESFPLGKRRYLCKRHTWLRLNKPSKERVLADPLKKLLWVLWKRCWNDAKTVFGHTRIALLQGDIAKVLSELEFEGGGGNGAFFDKVKGAACDTVEPAKSAIAFLPENPAQLLSQENFVIVHMDVRRDMLRAYRDGGVERYGEALGKLV